MTNLKSSLAIASFLALTLVATTYLYWPGLSGPFLVDDIGSVVPAQAQELNADELIRVALTNGSGRLGRPISVISFALTNYFHGVSPAAQKYHNLMIHLLIGVLLFWLGGRILKALMQNQQRAWGIAAIAATIWLLHPLFVSTVLYTVQRMAQLSTLFTVAALLTYTIARPLITAKPIQSVLIMGTGLFLFGGLAILSKENGALIPFYILIVEVFIFRYNANGRGKTSLYLFHSAFVFLPIIVGAYYYFSHLEHFLLPYDNREFSLPDRLMTQTHALWLYIGMIITPLLSKMSLFHDDFAITQNFDPTTLLTTIGLLALFVAAIWGWKRAPILGFGIAWFFVSHLLESSVFALELVFEHRNYTAAWGMALIIAYYALRPNNTFDTNRRLRTSLLTLFIIFIATLTNIRASTWSDNELLHRVTLEYHPTSSRTLVGMANIYLKEGNIDRAEEYIRKVVELYPQKTGPKAHLLMLGCKKNNIKQQQVDSVADSLRHDKIESYTAQTIHNTIIMHKNGNCPAITSNQLIQLTNAIIANPLSSNRTKYYIGVRQAIIYMDADMFNEAIERLRTVIPHSETAPVTYRHEGLYLLTQAQIMANDLPNARASLEKLESTYNNGVININKKVSTLKKVISELETQQFSTTTSSNSNHMNP